MSEVLPSTDLAPPPSVVTLVVNRTFSSNTYLVRTPIPGHCIVVDPGLDAELTEQALAAHGLRPVAVFCTHGHFDHVGSAAHFRKQYGIAVHLHGADQKLVKSANFMLMACHIDARIETPPIDALAADETVVEIDGAPLRFVHVPGHTPGSCFLRYLGNLFTGDTLYRNAVGLVDFPGENPAQLRASLLKVWDRLDESLEVYPGHGRSGPLGTIKATNRPLRAFLGLETPAASPASPAARRRRAGGPSALAAFKGELE